MGKSSNIEIKFGIGILGGAYTVVSRYIAPEFFDAILGGADNRAALEHVTSRMAFILLADSLFRIKAERAVLIFGGLLTIGVALQALSKQPIQYEQVVADAVGYGLGYAFCRLADRTHTNTDKTG